MRVPLVQAHPVLHVVFLLACAEGAQAQAVRFDPARAISGTMGFLFPTRPDRLPLRRTMIAYSHPICAAAGGGEAALGLTPTRRRITQDDLEFVRRASAQWSKDLEALQQAGYRLRGAGAGQNVRVSDTPASSAASQQLTLEVTGPPNWPPAQARLRRACMTRLAIYSQTPPFPFRSRHARDGRPVCPILQAIAM